MIDVEPLIVSGLDRLVPLPSGARADWQDVLRKAGMKQTSTRRPLAIALAALAAAVIVVVTTPVGAAIVRGIGDFSGWLTGHPGKPAASSAQRRFEAANGQSWASFPTSTKLRELIRTEVAGKRYVLSGFRSGNSVCLQLLAVWLDRSTPPTCAPASTLAHITAPILIVDGNDGFWDEHAHPTVQFSFGIAADGVSRVDVHATDGVHRAALGGNAYLWVENEPNTGNRVSRISAVGPDGRRSTATVADWSPMALATSASRPTRGPSRLQARIRDPHIGWYDRNEHRGLSLDQAKLTKQQRQSIKDLGGTRLVKPDPLSDTVVGLTGWCVFVVGGATFCNDQQHFFSQGPLDLTFFSRAQQFIGIAGAAADGVKAIKVFLADGEQQSAALRDNLFTAFVPDQPPIRVVAYDGRKRVVGIQTFRGFRFGTTAPPAATRSLRVVMRVKAPHGASATVRVGKTVKDVRCWQIQFSAGQTQERCDQAGRGSPWGAVVQPAGRDVFVMGHVGGASVRLRLLFATGDAITTRPKDGVFVFAVPRAHLSRKRQLAFVIGYNSFGYPASRQGVLFRANR